MIVSCETTRGVSRTEREWAKKRERKLPKSAAAAAARATRDPDDRLRTTLRCSAASHVVDRHFMSLHHRTKKKKK